MSQENNTPNANQGKKTKVVEKINEMKRNVESFVADINVNEIKNSVNNMMKDAQNDINKLVDKDLDIIKKKFLKEKMALEKKAKKFLDGQKREINELQTKFEKLVRKSAKKPVVKAAPVSTTKKKVNKKVAKAVKKIAKKK